MNNYALYNVKHVNSFKKFLTIIEQYDDDIAFKNKNNEWSYLDFCNDIKVVASNLMKYKQRLIVVNLKDTRLFAIVYFAIVLSGNIAVLVDEIDLKEIGIDNYMIMEKEMVTNLLKGGIKELPDTDIDSLCTIVCSSGTTSFKKGVMLSQKNLLSDMVGGMELYEYSKGAIYVNFLPYTHLFGIIADLMGPLYSGGTICIAENKLCFFEELQYYKPTNLNLPPALVQVMYTMLLRTNNFNKATGGKLRKVMCAGARMNDKVNNEFSKYGLRIYAAYGLTECSPCVTMNRDYYYKPGSVGLPLPCCNVEIIDDEIVVSGDNVMLGYYKNKQTTEKVRIEGKLYTGDLGFFDEDGFVFLTGRKSNIIVFEDGIKIVPEIIEEKINDLNGVKESLVEPICVNEKTKLQIIITKDDKYHSEEISEEIYDLLKRMELQSMVHNIIVQKEELEKNALGKILRKKN